MRIIWVILLLICACNNSDKQTNVNEKSLVEQTEDIDADGERVVSNIEPDSLSSNNSRSFLIRHFNRDYSEIEEKDILSIKELSDSLNVDGFGNASLLQIELSESLPEVIPKTNYLLVNKEKKIAALFLLDSIMFFQPYLEKEALLIGALKKVKAKGYFYLYRFDGNRFFRFLNTMDFCENGVPIFNNSIDCISYNPFLLSSDVVDNNGDGISDINFSGQVAFFCKDLENGYGREERDPIEQKKIFFSLVLSKDSLGRFQGSFDSKRFDCGLLK